MANENTVTLESLMDGFENRMKGIIEGQSKGTEMSGPNAGLATAIMGQESEIKGPYIEVMDDGSVKEFTMTDQNLAKWQNAMMGAAITAPIEGPLNKFGPSGINIGSMVVGGGTGLAIGEIIDGLAGVSTVDEKNIQNLAFKAVAIFLLNNRRMGGRLLSSQAAFAASAVLAIQIAEDVLPVDRWISRLRDFVVDKFSGSNQFSNDVVAQAEQVRRSYQATQPAVIRGAAGEDQLEDVL